MCCWISSEQRWRCKPPLRSRGKAVGGRRAAVSYTQILMKTLVNIHTGEVSGQQASEKEQVLFAKLGEHESMLIALSGGTDSAYLAWAAHRVLGKRALSVTALSPSYSTYDREQLEKFLDRKSTRLNSSHRP